MSMLFSFPGQGAQQPGMLHALPGHTEVKRTLEQAAQKLGRDPLSLDTVQALQSTTAVQLCLTIAGVAMARVLIAEGARPDMVAGFSIGEFPAAVIAGALDYGDALGLVAERGRLMEEAYPTGYGMAAIVGLDRTELESLIARVHTEAAPVYLANLNADRQFAVSGANSALDALMSLSKEHGAGKAERLAVVVPSHCPLLLPAAQQLAKAFDAVHIHKPGIRYLSSSAARVLFQAGQIGATLAGNMAKQVHWSETMRLAWERGARLAIEMPTGSVLSKLTEPIFEGGQAISCQSTDLKRLVVLASHYNSETR